ncbi:hypothetical protein GCM10010862_37880 [Devosia nitrariae]|uniref:Response regulatory domain-containing protein n=1 Tax=Devosia nitrariae TaxID=2071872 RepID=A0ABQ5W8U6_9HYPH|nr:hypothetical protein GCM10010862_37880 [Devosia nitrariae]
MGVATYARAGPLDFLDKPDADQFLDDIGHRLQAERHIQADFLTRRASPIADGIEHCRKIAITGVVGV